MANIVQAFMRPWVTWNAEYALYVLNDCKTSEVFRSGKNGEHPEEFMLVELWDKLPGFEYASLRITVYQNYSPCRPCSDKYLDFIGRARQYNIQLDLTIVFIVLYNIRRSSHSFIPSPLQTERQNNLMGLLRLDDRDVKLKSFDFNDWSKLRKYLSIFSEWTREKYEGSTIQKHNEAVAKDLDTLLAPNREEKFAVLWRSGLPQFGGKGARCLYTCGACGPSPLFQNQSQEEHAEHFLLPHLEQHLSEPHPSRIEVTVYQNLSPCGDCCTDYRDFQTKVRMKNKSMKVSIVFATFYNISRPTCPWKDVKQSYHDNNLQGLRRLRDEGVHLRSFTFYDWLELAKLLQATPKTVAEYVNSGRKGEDDSMVEDMERLRLLPSGPAVQAGEEAVAARSGQAAAWERLSKQIHTAVREVLEDAGLQPGMTESLGAAVSAAVKEALGVEDLELALADTAGRAVAQKTEGVPLELEKGAQAAALEAEKAVTQKSSSAKQTMGEEVSKAVSRQMEATGRDTARLLQDAVTRELKTSVMPSIQEKVAAELVAELPEAVQADTADLLELSETAARSSMVEEGEGFSDRRLGSAAWKPSCLSWISDKDE